MMGYFTFEPLDSLGKYCYNGPTIAEVTIPKDEPLLAGSSSDEFMANKVVFGQEHSLFDSKTVELLNLRINHQYLNTAIKHDSIEGVKISLNHKLPISFGTIVYMIKHGNLDLLKVIPKDVIYKAAGDQAKQCELQRLAKHRNHHHHHYITHLPCDDDDDDRNFTDHAIDSIETGKIKPEMIQYLCELGFTPNYKSMKRCENAETCYKRWYLSTHATTEQETEALLTRYNVYDKIKTAREIEAYLESNHHK